MASVSTSCLVVDILFSKDKFTARREHKISGRPTLDLLHILLRCQGLRHFQMLLNSRERLLRRFLQTGSLTAVSFLLERFDSPLVSLHTDLLDVGLIERCAR